jgi:hypothetical protein
MKRLLAAAILIASFGLPSLAQADEVIIVHTNDRSYYDHDYSTTPFAQGGRFGLRIGATSLVTGITGKGYFGNVVALQGTLGWWYHQGPVLNMDLIFEMPHLASGNAVSLNWNFGFGATVGFETYNHNPGDAYAAMGGINGVLGLGLQIKPVPLEFVIELRPTYILGSGDLFDGFYFGAGLSVRYFFR